MKFLNIIFLSLFTITSAQASGSPEIQCWLGVKVKKYSVKERKYLAVKQRIGLYIPGLDRMEEVENPSHYPISGDIMFQIETPKDARGYSDTKDLTDLNPADINQIYGDYLFADSKGNELKYSLLDIHFSSNSGSAVKINLVSSKEGSASMSGTAYFNMSRNDENRLMRAMENNGLDFTFDLKELKKVAIVCEYNWS